MSLQLGFFYRMDANTFSKLRSFKKAYSQIPIKREEIKFMPLLELKQSEVKDLEACLHQLRQYTFLMNQNELELPVSFDSYKIINQAQVCFSGRYDFEVIGEIFVDLKLLFENKFTNQLIPMAERFLAPSIVALEAFNPDELEEVLTTLEGKQLHKMQIELVHFGYIDNRQEDSQFVRSTEVETKNANQERLNHNVYH